MEKLEIVWDRDCGDVFIDGEFASQLCWEPDSVGYAVSNWLQEHEK